MENLEWSLPEYEDKERSRDWYWALGIIVVCGSVTSIIYKDYFFAALLVLGGLLLGFFSMKKPDIVTYELGPRGLKAGDRFYTYNSIKSFSVLVGRKPMLVIHSARVFVPIITIPIEEEMAEDIHEMMLASDVPEEDIRPHSSETIMDSLGF